MRFHTRLEGVLTGLAFLWLAACVAAAQPDGPYVLKGAAGGWEAVSVEVTPDGARRQSRSMSDSQALAIPAVGSVPSFMVKLRAPAPDAPDTVTTARDVPLFVVADTHGEYEILVTMLRTQKVVDAKLHWSFGRGHVVVLGDVFDRGPNHLEILWLLYQLQAEAERAGGGMHLVLGNHEVMAMTGDLRYLHPKYVESAQALGVSSYSELFSRDTVLGQWLRSRPAMLRVNDYLCLHAGVSRALLDSRLTLTDINASVRSVLNGEDAQGAIAQMVMGTFGPLWYRGYFADQVNFPTASDEDIDLTLKAFGVRRILIGHTIVPTITPLYDGRVIAVQVYPKRDDAGHANFAGLFFRKGALWQAGLDGSLRRFEKPR